MAIPANLPKRISEDLLDTIPEDWRIAYIDYNDDGNLQLSSAVAVYVSEQVDELARMKELVAAKKAEKDAAAKKKTDRIKRFLSKKFEAAGVTKPAFQPAVVLMLMDQYKFDTEKREDGLDWITAETPFGKIDNFDQAVEDVLNSEEGRGFRTATKAEPKPGMFSSLLGTKH